MKYLTLFFCICLLPLFSVAQTKAEKEVAAAVETLRLAMVNGDKQVLQQITAEELTYGHSSGTIEDKAAFIAAVVNPDFDYVSIELSNLSIKLVDKNLAWARHQFLSKTNSKGVTGTLKLGVLTIWQKQKGSWKLVARQGFKLP